MTEPCILACDPGLTGALAWFFPSAPERICAEDMPIVGGLVDVQFIRRRIQQMGPTLAIIEQVNAMPSMPGANGKRRAMGATSAFNFGAAYAAAETAISLSDVPLYHVRPADWKKHLRLPGGEEGKEAGRLMAIRMFPASADRFARKKDHGRSDAALLALYAAGKLLPQAPSAEAA